VVLPEQLLCLIDAHDFQQLVGQFMHLIPNADQWLDNLAQGRLVHKDLLPIFKTFEEQRAWENAK